MLQPKLKLTLQIVIAIYKTMLTNIFKISNPLYIYSVLKVLILSCKILFTASKTQTTRPGQISDRLIIPGNWLFWYSE